MIFGVDKHQTISEVNISIKLMGTLNITLCCCCFHGPTGFFFFFSSNILVLLQKLNFRRTLQKFIYLFIYIAPQILFSTHAFHFPLGGFFDEDSVSWSTMFAPQGVDSVCQPRYKDTRIPIWKNDFTHESSLSLSNLTLETTIIFKC